MTRIRLVHWKPEEAEEGIRLLENSGLEVHADPVVVSSFIQELEADRPDAVLIDLSRAPSHGRELAIALRLRKGTRSIPLVFVGGKPEKVEKIRELLPDAGYSEWEKTTAVIERVVREGVKDPIVPESVFAAYAGKPLTEKLGIKAGFIVALVGAPQGFDSRLGRMPEGSVLVEGVDEGSDLTIWFVRTEGDLHKALPGITDASKRGPVWIAWPKKGSKMQGELAQQIVRERGMAVGMVDYKICSIDQDWSALLFKWRGTTT